MNRERFAALGEWARLDGPGGTLMVDSAIAALRDAAAAGLANHGGVFAAAEKTDAVVEDARAAVAALLGGAPREIAFGPSMSAMTMRFAAAAQPGRVVCTRLDHDANVAPWLLHAREVVFAEPDPDTLALPARAVERVLTDDTEWVAVTAASNAVGSVPELAGIIRVAHAAGAKVYVDAVHAAPHRPIDVAALGCDALVCSAYKWFGPHVGVLWAREELLASLPVRKLRPSPDTVPERWELGTLPFEQLAAVRAAADYVQGCDWAAVRRHEQGLLDQALDGLRALPRVKLHGACQDRTPTLMFSVAGMSPEEVARGLAARQVAVWHGNYYAYELERHLGLAPHGAVRAGFVHYNDASDAQRLVEGVAELAG